MAKSEEISTLASVGIIAAFNFTTNQIFLSPTPSLPTSLSSTRPYRALSAYRTPCKGITRDLLCQRFDENAERLASALDAPFYVVHLDGLTALFCGKRIAPSHSARYGESQRKVAA